MATIQHVTTAEQLLAAGDIGRCELVRGELITMSPAGSEHGWMVSQIAVLGTSETLDGGDLLPNFSLPVSELFQ